MFFSNLSPRSRHKTTRQSRFFAYAFLLLGLTLFWWGQTANAAPQHTHDSEAQAEIEAAWAKVEGLQSYTFRSKVKQDVYPTPSIVNAGRPPEVSLFALQGELQVSTQRIESILWPDHTFDPASGVDMLIENGRSYIREHDQAEWELINDFGESFAPGGDPFSFLAGMSNVQETGTTNHDIGGIVFTFDTYTFDLNSTAFALYVERLTAQTAATNHDIPQGFGEGKNERLRSMTGHGQVWLDEQGNLARLSMGLTMPIEETGELVKAQLTTDFYDFIWPETAESASFMAAPLAHIQTGMTTLAHPTNASVIGSALLGMALFVLLAIFVWQQAGTQAFYNMIAFLVIAGMVLPPLLQAKEVHAYYEAEVARSHEADADAQKQEQQETLQQTLYANNWYPHQDPFAADQVIQEAKERLDAEAASAANLALLANESDDEVDSDGDGVSDENEILWDSCPYPYGSTAYTAEEDCTDVTDVSDSDGDGLSDFAEITQIGTLPDLADSDGDSITDTHEVAGFSYNGEQWYSDPLNDDTNNDGLTDGLECFERSSSNDDFDETAVCADSDNDGLPDLFDTDDDNDGVWDVDDGAPSTAGETYDYDNPLALTIDGLEIDKPVQVELQFRPTDAAHLTYSGLVLDWTDGDYGGQVTKGLTTTFATTGLEEAYSTADNASYGDLRIVPMIQVTIPYTDGHYGNLPVNDTYYGIDRTIGITSEQWLDSTELDEYGITINDADETSGELAAYIPLSTMYSSIDNSPIAFATTMLYFPTQGTDGIAEWGEAHQYRLVWMVQMLTDACAEDVDEDGDGDTDNETGEDCTREESLDVIHMYHNESWQLASLTVSEQHGLDVAQLYENPAEGNLAMEDQMWIYAWNMANTFIEGVDCDSTTTNADGSVDCVGDGTPDVTLDNLEAKLDEWGTAEEDSINYNYVEFEGVHSYIHDDYLTHVAVTETATILDSVFLSYVSQQDYVSILTAYEVDSRNLSFNESAVDANGSLTLDMTGQFTETMAAMIWETYAYDSDTAEWAAADTEAYLEYLTDYLETNVDYFMAEDDTDDAADEVEGKLLWAQSYYATLITGVASITQLGGTAVTSPSFTSTDEEEDYLGGYEVLIDAAGTPAARRLGYLVYYRLSDLFANTTREASAWKFMRLMYSADDLIRSNAFNLSYSADSLGRKIHPAYKSANIFGIKKLDAKIRQNLSYNGWPKALRGSLKLFVVGAALIAVGTLLNQTSLSAAGTIIVLVGVMIVAAASIALISLEIIGLLRKEGMVKYIKAAKVLSSQDLRMKSYAKTVKRTYTKTYARMAAYGAAMTILLTAATLAYAWISLGNAQTGYIFDTYAAYLIATIIVELIFLILAAIFPVGTIITMVIEIVDLVLFVLDSINQLFNLGWDIPGQFSAYLTQLVADSIYEFDMVIDNMEDENRLAIDFGYDLLHPAQGFIHGNSLVVTTSITNTIWATHNNDTRSDLKRNGFVYLLSSTTTALDNVTVDGNSNDGAWENVTYAEYSTYYPDTKDYGDTGVWLTEAVDLIIPFSDQSTGVNVATADTFLLEKYYIIGEGCWQFAGFDTDCKDYSFEDTIEIELGAFTFDVLPDTLTEFVDLDWSDVSTMALPEQYDQDGDGLINKHFGGSDPNDKTADTDGDGLHDYDEISAGYNAEAADGDSDGLSDWEEAAQYYTDPASADTDGDGLSDYIEAKQGWLIGYTDSNGATQVTRVWSDPFSDDLDDDGLGDLQEYLYGFHPAIENDASDVDNLIEFENMSLTETAGPQFILKFEDDEGDTVTTDNSGYGHNFSCDESAGQCPMAEADGVYGQAFTFDGSDDWLTLDGIDWDLTAYTTAAWIYSTADDNNFHGIMGLSNGGSQYRAPSMYVTSNTKIHGGFGDGSNWNSFTTGDVINLNTWHHVATTFDGTTLTVYVDGSNVLEKTFSGAVPYSFTSYGIGRISSYFEGHIDEAVFYDFAMTESEIDELMNGRYDTNDLLVRPGAELSYQATITNTSASRNANGFLYAAASVSSPELPEPIYAFPFENEQRVAYFPSAFNVGHWTSTTIEEGGVISCIDDGSCPTAGATGAFSNSLSFDGLDDVVYVPKLSSEINEIQENEDENRIFFWIYVDDYPSSGQTAMILDTDSSRAGATDIYIDSSGYLYFDLDSYGTGVSTSVIPKDQWVHVAYRQFELTIDGGVNGAGHDIFSGLDNSAAYPTFGPGRLGNSLDGSAPFAGRIDELAVYHTSVSDSELYDHIYQGDYHDGGSGLRPDVVFSFEELIEGQDGTNVGYLNAVTGLRAVDCVDSSIECPEATADGKYGSGVIFDGVDDALHFTDNLYLGQTDYTVALWFKTTDTAHSFISASDDDGQAFWARINGDGRVRYRHNFPGNSSNHIDLRSDADFGTLADGEWHYYTGVFEEDTVSLYIDGVLLKRETEVTSVFSTTLSAVIGYQSTSGGDFFSGEIDELVIFDEALDGEGITYLMNSTYPALEIDTLFTEFSLDALATAVPSGTVTVADHVASGSVHTFAEEVEVALDFETEPTLTTYYHADDNTDSESDSNGDDTTWYTGYFRFEDEPGSTSFNNLVFYNTFGTTDRVDTTVEIPLTCLAESCPIAGVPGVDGRALYFDGIDDYLYATPQGAIVLTSDGTYDDLTSAKQPEVQSISAWVNGTRGTIFNRGSQANGYHLQVDFGRVSYIDASDNYVYVDFDMPVNEWTHLLVAIEDGGGINIYVNGENVAYLWTDHSSAGSLSNNWIVGANYGTQNHFQGYIDDLRFYDVEVGATWAERHYSAFVEYLRFDFDEADGEAVFTDRVRGHVATPVYIDCVDLALETLTVQELDDELTHLAIDVDGENLYYDSVADFGGVVTGTTVVSLSLNITAPICLTDHTITARGIYSDGTELSFSGSGTATIAETAATDTAFTSGSQQLTLTYSAGALYNTTTPVAGTDGRIGNTVYFPGDETGYLEISDSEGLGDFATDNWTMMTWIRTDIAGGNPIFAKDDGDGINEAGEKFIYINTDGTIAMTAIGASQDFYMNSTEPITDSVWHHVAIKWNAGGSYGIFVDGVDVTDSGTYDGSVADNAGDSWKLGRRGTDSAGHKYFTGELDEFVIYLGRTMSSDLIYETYLREARWYRDTAQFSVLVDDDNPTIEVQTDYQYLSSGNVILVATPDDATSGIALVQFGVKGPSDSEYTWDTAELCADSAVVYCPTFFADTEGSYEVIYRLVDAVGNETTSELYNYYVDLTAPTATGTATAAEAIRVASVATLDRQITAASIDLSVVISQTSDISWIATFGGTWSDPEVDSGIEGSGIDEDAFYVTVYNSAGTAVGTLNQTATVDEDNGTWTIDYVMVGLNPAGAYTVKVTVEDEKENEAEMTIGTFETDQQEPNLKMAHQLWPDQIISDTNVIHGVVTDQYVPSGPLFRFPFEETESESAFYNYGEAQEDIPCSATCPHTTASGAFGRGLDFDGAAGWSLEAEVVSDALNTAVDETFSIALWVLPDVAQANAGENSNSIIEKWDGSGAYPYAIRYLNQNNGSDSGLVVASRSDGTTTTMITSTTNIGDNQFHHIALVLEDNVMTLYVDGVPNGSVADATGTTTNSQNLMVGYRSGDANTLFSGVLDELFLYDRALSGDEVYASAQNNVNGNNQVEVAVETIDFASYPDLLTINEDQDRATWASATLDQVSGLGSAWTYTLADMEGFAYLHLRGEDGGGNEVDALTTWHGLIDHISPTVTLTGTQSGYGALGETAYTFTLSDIVLDVDSAVYPCASPDLATLTYDDANLPHDGLVYQISGSCTVDSLDTTATLSVCDSVGHCTSETIMPSVTIDLGAIGILTPTAVLTSTASGQPVEIAGIAVAANEIMSVSVLVNDILVETISYGSGMTETDWSTTSWTPTITGVYTITTWLTDTTGDLYNDQLVLTIDELTSDGQLALTEVASNGSDLTFTWVETNVSDICDVTIYRSTADPYSGFTSWTTVNASPATVAVSAGETAYYYLAAAGCTQQVSNSETMGVFHFSLTAGD